MSNNKGFTLIELMISIAMTGIIVAAIYSVYTLSQKTATAQEQVAEMQQNIRIALLTIMPEIRMAGFDPSDAAGATIKRVETDLVYFTADLNEDGDLNDKGEHVAFGLYTDNDDGVSVTRLGITRDNDNISIIQGPPGHFEAERHQPIAENIEKIEFLYDNDDNSITISILARAAWKDSKFVNDSDYTPASEDTWDLNGIDTAGTTPNDPYRRRLLITSVQCRNMGL